MRIRIVAMSRFGFPWVKPNEGVLAAIGFCPSFQPRLKRRAHADDQIGTTEVARLLWADLKAVRLAVGRHDIFNHNLFFANNMNPVSDDRETRDYERLGLGAGLTGQENLPDEAKNGD